MTIKTGRKPSRPYDNCGVVYEIGKGLEKMDSPLTHHSPARSKEIWNVMYGVVELEDENHSA